MCVKTYPIVKNSCYTIWCESNAAVCTADLVKNNYNATPTLLFQIFLFSITHKDAYVR